MKTSFEMVREFHEAFGHPVRTEPTADVPEASLRRDLLEEEWVEYLDALQRGDIVQMADALADMKYIIDGTALVHGIDLDAVTVEVHRSNMAKLGPNGEVVRREDGKILKPEGWTPPNIQAVLFGEEPDPLTTPENGKAQVAQLRANLPK